MSDARTPSIHSALEPSSSFLLAILEGVPDAMFVKDRERRYVLVNDPFIALAGATPEQILLRTDDAFLGAEHVERYLATDLAVFASGTPIRTEERYVDHRGDVHVLATTKVALRDGVTSEITHLVGIIYDITQLKHAEDALRNANEELEGRVEERTEALRGAQQELLRKERLAVLGQLAGGLAHQIRNPLAAISNAGSVLKRRLGDSVEPDVQSALAVIREEVWEANRIITDLLDYARIRPPSLAPVTVSALIESAMPMARAGDDIVIDRQIDPSLRANIDERQTRDAIGNVLRNAIEAMPTGGTLTIEAYREGDTAVLLVADTGPGLTRASLAYLFEPLVTSKPLGLGLGLATAKSLIENQGGSIRCQTNTGRGARFEIRIPASDE